jgi:glyoxylase-like metal-dependent hydrolase (beta-lactamase superfamily II)
MKAISVGDIAVSSIIERDGPWRPPAEYFPQIDPALARARLLELEPFVYDAAQDLLIITYQSFIVRTRHHVIMIDTCMGEIGKGHGLGPKMDYPRQPWLDGLAAEGLGFADITHVFCTHLHFDHCGWNTRLVDGRWVPTFPNATYIFSRREYEHWATFADDPDGPQGSVWRESCLPVLEAGQARLVDDDFALDDQVWLTPSAGHSPGHVCVNLRSNGARALFTGDMMHHAVQCLEPGWSTVFCSDRAAAARTRRRVLQEVADSDVLVVPAHFPGATAGHVVGAGEGFRFRFLGG